MSYMEELAIATNLMASKPTLVIASKQVDAMQASLNSIHNLIGVAGTFVRINCDPYYGVSEQQLMQAKAQVPADGVIYFCNIHIADSKTQLMALEELINRANHRIIMSGCDPCPAAIENRCDVIRM